MKTCSNPLQLERFSAALIDGLKAELYLTPKPGLVDLTNNGSHPDLSLLLMSRSICLLHDYLRELCRALAGSYSYADLVAIGQAAEQRMYRELGTNSHRGGIFLCGLLLTASAQADPADPVALQQAVKKTAEAFLLIRESAASHGETVRRQHPRAGILHEARQGLPALFETALPVLLHSREQPSDAYLAMAQLMQRMEDSTSLHRCGEVGLAMLRKSGKRLETCLVSGEDPLPLLATLDREFRLMNLTMGGVADLLGLGFGYAGYLQRFSGAACPEHSTASFPARRLY